MRFRNFARFDLFSSFHIRVNCWSLSSAIVATASTLDENAAKAERADSVRHGNWRTSVARNRALIRLFFRRHGSRPVSIRERDDQIVSDRFDPIGGEGELRGQFLRLARLEIPRAVAILAGNQELLAVIMAVVEYLPIVRALC